MNFCPGYERIMSLLQSFIDKNRVNVSKISFIEPIARFHEIQTITKMNFNIPLIPLHFCASYFPNKDTTYC